VFEVERHGADDRVRVHRPSVRDGPTGRAFMFRIGSGRAHPSTNMHFIH
jgi:hypothetical protein